MSSAEQQLQADFALVKKLLQTYPRIKIVATKGEPPEQYDLEYHLKGYRENADGTILPASRHQVRITLPFGYPHFPPTAKPLSPIFHPDIDPEAIRIAEFWKDDKSLPDLIIHIGKMICGTFYSDDPFNQRAYDWFEERKSWMPFDILEPHDDDEECGKVEKKELAGESAVAEAGEKSKPILPDEEINLDFAGVGTGGTAVLADESTELNDLLDGELSFAFDLDEPQEETAGDQLREEERSGLQLETEMADIDLEMTLEEQPSMDIQFEDLTAESEEIPQVEFEPETVSAEEAIDLTGFQEEEPSLDFGLALEPTPDLETQTGDLAGDEEQASSGGFQLESESALPELESLDFGDLPSMEIDSLISGLAQEPTESSAPAEPPAPEPRDEGIAIDFGIAESSLTLPKETPPPTPVDDDNVLGGFSLELDADQKGKFGDLSSSIRPLIDKKEIFTAKKYLADIADPNAVKDKEELELTVSAAISEAEDLFRKAAKNEQRGDLEKAGVLLDLVANIAVDYPGLELARNRIRDALLEAGQKKTTEPGSGTAAPPESGAPSRKAAAAVKLKRKVPVKLLALLLGLIVILGGAVLLYLRDNSALEQARSEIAKGKQLADKMNFKEADNVFNNARTGLSGVLLLRSSKTELSQAIDAIANTQSFKEGVKGRVLYNGEYVSVETAKAIEGFNRLVAAGQKAADSGNTDQALESYAKSLDLVEKAGMQDKAEGIQQIISSLKLQQTLAMAKKAEADQDWQGATAMYEKALALAGPGAQPEVTGEITKHLSAANLRLAVGEGGKAFAASEWTTTIEVLLRAQKIIDDQPGLLSDVEKVEVSKMLANARVYQVLADAKTAYSNKDWGAAVREYDHAIALLQENEPILGREEVTDSIGKIKKTALMTSIAKEQSQIEREAQTSSAKQSNIEHYRTIVSLIGQSSLQNDPVLKGILTDSQSQIASLKSEILIDTKVEYLKENYKTIFLKNYPSAKSSELLNPQISFVKQDGDIMVFAMSCAERNQGRTFRLELNYQFDLAKGAWGLYSGKL